MPRRRLLSAEPRAGAGRDERTEFKTQQQAMQTTRSAVREGEGSAAFEARAGAAEEWGHATRNTQDCTPTVRETTGAGRGQVKANRAHHQGAARRLVKHTVWATVYGAGDTGLACANSALSGLFLKSFFSFLCYGKRLSAVLSFVFFIILWGLIL